MRLAAVAQMLGPYAKEPADFNLLGEKLFECGDAAILPFLVRSLLEQTLNLAGLHRCRVKVGTLLGLDEEVKVTIRLGQGNISQVPAHTNEREARAGRGGDLRQFRGGFNRRIDGGIR